MQPRKQSSKKTCPHKQQRLSLDSKIVPIRKLAITHKSPDFKLKE